MAKHRGGIHTIDSVLNDRVEVRDSGGGAPTTVNLLNGGDVTGLAVFGMSLANMSGGFVGQDGFFEYHRWLFSVFR